MQNYAVTSLIGGTTPGSYSSDIFYMDHGGQFVLNDGANNTLNSTYPIHQISVSSGWIVDGISVSYNLQGGEPETAIVSHGSVFNPPNGVVTFGANEVLAAVYGREGYHTTYKRDMITNIAFVVFNTNTEQYRTAGPFGNGDGSNQGQPFWTSDVLALGSFGQSTPSLGLSGLLFFRNPSSSTNKGLMPPFNFTGEGSTFPSNWTNNALTPSSNSTSKALMVPESFNSTD
ncbi:hypothetical protein GSI_05346 [Ganoderma sinense ZZ0214-1]|uniref:Uncharacterized protein n=1 Tax=Ganoderma sinense ZZ0214-1 TaxID=1077348 RepID=A0A2G8SFV6_9APHY|nr:hypothetical protein GSI_05346 [Ganoderma sinense ZZ0214-1]